MDFSEIRAWREGLGLTQSEAGVILGVSRFTLAKMEKSEGVMPWHLDRMIFMAERRFKHRDDGIPLTLVYMSESAEGLASGSYPMVVEDFDNAKAMIDKARKVSSSGPLLFPQAVDSRSPFSAPIWTTEEILEAIKR